MPGDRVPRNYVPVDVIPGLCLLLFQQCKIVNFAAPELIYKEPDFIVLGMVKIEYFLYAYSA